MSNSLRYRKTSEVEVVGKTDDGFKVQNVGHPEDVWVVPYGVFEATYKPFRDEVDKDIENCFMYHAPKPGQQEVYIEIRNAAKELAYLINQKVPKSRERSLAMTKLEEMVMWANTGVARN